MPDGTFPPEGLEVTHLYVVRDLERSTRFYRDVLGAEPPRPRRPPAGDQRDEVLAL
ncbi:MAG: VOC family protein [Actinomycetota bacterium]